MITLLNHRNKYVCALLLVGVAAITAKDASDFEQLLINPLAFHGKRVSLIGIAHVIGDEFFLYQNASEAEKARPWRAVIIVRHRRGPLYKNLNNHWVKITGVVHANSHGLLGTSPCEIALIDVERLSRASIEDRDVYGVFRNDTGVTVNLQGPAPAGYAHVQLKPGQLRTFVVVPGSVVLKDAASGNVLFRTELKLEEMAEPYIDFGKKTCYYSITKSGIKRVSSAEAKAWRR